MRSYNDYEVPLPFRLSQCKHPMKKLKLDLDDVQVESFLTSAEVERMETVHGYQEGIEMYTERFWSCEYPGCPTVDYGSCHLNACPPAFN